MNDLSYKLDKINPGESESEYLDRIYRFFIDKFINDRIPWSPGSCFIGCRREPEIDGRGQTFYHITSSSVGDSRVVDYNRCSRLKLIPQMIRNFNTLYPNRGDGSSICWWESPRPRSPRRIAISLPDFSYAVFIDPRDGYAVLVTAVFYEYESRRKKFRKAWEEHWRVDVSGG